VVGRRDGAAGALGPAHRPELLEVGRAQDRGRVGARVEVDVVDRSVARDGALGLRAGRGVVRAKGLDDVELDERVSGPAVDAQVAVAVGIVAAGIVDDPASLSVCVI